MGDKPDMDAITEALAQDYADSLANDPGFRLEVGRRVFRNMSDDEMIRNAQDALSEDKLKELGITPDSPAARRPAGPQALYALVRRARDEIKAAGGFPGGDDLVEELDALIDGIELLDALDKAGSSTGTAAYMDVLKADERRMYDVLSSTRDELEASGGFLGDEDLFDTIAATLCQSELSPVTPKRRRAGPQ